MPRTPRGELSDGVYHVYARGNAKEAIYRDDRDRRIYLQVLETTIGRSGWTCLSYCLMNNHVHLLLESPGTTLSGGMHRLHTSYAQRFNLRHDRVGHLFQGRFGLVPVQSDAQLCVAAAYIARNPVDAGLCQRPEEWIWSSYAAAAGAASGPVWVASDQLLSFFGSRKDVARHTFAAFAAVPPDLWGQSPDTRNGDSPRRKDFPPDGRPPA
jgi:putative transposase